jgi:hypothetical protein
LGEAVIALMRAGPVTDFRGPKHYPDGPECKTSGTASVERRRPSRAGRRRL